MTYVVTYIEVPPGSTSQALTLIRDYRTASRAEEGCSGIEILLEVHRENRIVIMETWNDEAQQVHETAEQTSEFRSRLKDIHKSPYDQRVHHDFAVAPYAGVPGSEAVFVVTHVDVPPPRKEETEVLLKSVVEQFRKDAGNLRFDVFQQNAPRTNHFTIVAVWENEEAFSFHETTIHTRQFREALGPMLGALYDERLYRQLGGLHRGAVVGD
jgi:quinol monooxygenase YgiN